MSEPETSAVPDGYLDDGRLRHDGWARALQKGILLGQECADCGHATAAPKAACARCGSAEIQPVRLPTEGQVYTETTVHVPPEQFDGPYQVALVTLGDARVMARVEGEAAIGDRVRLSGTVEADREPAPLFGPPESGE